MSKRLTLDKKEHYYAKKQKTMPRHIQERKKVVKFNSGLGPVVRPLSNFYACTITLDTKDIPEKIQKHFLILQNIQPGAYTFASTEHLWQALKARTVDCWSRFLVGGIWGGFLDQYPFDQDSASQRPKDQTFGYWKKKNCVGVIAKMAVNLARVKRHGWQNLLNLTHERLEEQMEEQVWLWILRMKFLQEGLPQQTLKNTGDSYLLELERMANQKTHWGGKVDEDGLIIGDNVMGKYLMKIREELY